MKYQNPDIIKKKQAKLQERLDNLKQEKIEPIQRELSVLSRALEQRKPFESGDILTDGETIIQIGYVLAPNWTPTNNYGRKDYEYNDCSYFQSNKNSEVWPILNGWGQIPAMWFSKGNHLEKFIKVNKSFFDKKILEKLEIKRR
jgi:hypothetical protein